MWSIVIIYTLFFSYLKSRQLALQQNELNARLTNLEDQVKKEFESKKHDLLPADRERLSGFQLAQNVSVTLEAMQRDLEVLVEEVNSTSSEVDDPTASVISALNYHLAALQNLDQKSEDLKLKMASVENMFNLTKKNFK